MVIVIVQMDVSVLKLEMAYATRIVVMKHVATTTAIVNVPQGAILMYLETAHVTNSA